MDGLIDWALIKTPRGNVFSLFASLFLSLQTNITDCGNLVHYHN